MSPSMSCRSLLENLSPTCLAPRREEREACSHFECVYVYVWNMTGMVMLKVDGTSWVVVK